MLSFDIFLHRYCRLEILHSLSILFFDVVVVSDVVECRGYILGKHLFDCLPHI